MDSIEIEDANDTITTLVRRNHRSKLFIETECVVVKTFHRFGVGKPFHGRPYCAELISKLTSQVALDGCRLHYRVLTDRTRPFCGWCHMNNSPKQGYFANFISLACQGLG